MRRARMRRATHAHAECQGGVRRARMRRTTPYAWRVGCGARVHSIVQAVGLGRCKWHRRTIQARWYLTQACARTPTYTHAQQMPELGAAAGHVSVMQVTASPNSRCALKFLSLRHRGGDTLTECTAFTAFTACAALTAFTACTAHSQHAPRLLVFAVPCSRHLIGCAWLCMGGGQVRAT